jgi:processive 1,2-diacylglycerol beta-glucosyltransferase
MKILITHASAGAGHRKAAEALYIYLRENSAHQVALVDALDHARPGFKRLYAGCYAFLITHVPNVWGFAFALIDAPVLQPFIRAFRRSYNALNLPGYHALLIKEQYDFIFSTHFLPNEVAAALKREGKIASRIVSIITDFDVHRIWLAEGINIYAVACSQTKEKLKFLGVIERNIFVSGIPSDKKFSRSHDVEALKKKMGLKKDEFTVLVATGSFGIGPIERIVAALKDYQLIVICGHNKELYDRLKKTAGPNVFVNSLIDNMEEMMAVADCMVTKPGGLSITEALVSQLPMIFFNAIPGQEMHNVLVLRKYGIGAGPCSVEEIAGKLGELRASKDAHRSAVNKLKELAKPQAVKDLSSLIV